MKKIKNSITLMLFLAAFFSFPGYAVSSSRGKIRAVEPNVIHLGQQQKIKVIGQGFDADDQLVLAPGGPYTKGVLAAGGEIQALTLGPTHGYVAVADAGLLSVDYSNGKPIVAGKYHLDAPATKLLAKGNRLYASDRSGNLKIFDATHPESLLLLQTFETGNVIHDFDVEEDLAFLASNATLKIIDISDPAHPAVIGSHSFDSPVTALLVRGHRCFVGLGNKGIQVLDVSNPASITAVASYNTTGSVKDLSLLEEYLYVADGMTGLTVLDVGDRSNIRWAGSHNGLGDLRSIGVEGDRGLAVSEGSRLYLLDLSKRERPKIISVYKAGNGAVASGFRPGEAVVATQGTLKWIDFSEEAIPKIASNEVNLGGARKVFLRDNLAYVANWFSGLQIWDISTPRRPILMSTFLTPGSPKGILVRGDYAYMGDDDWGLQIMDISDPLNVKPVGGLKLPGLAYSLKLEGDLLYLADHGTGFRIIDVSDVAAPKLIGGVNTPGNTWGIDLVDNKVYLADDNTGLLIFDVADPLNPKKIGQFKPGGGAEDVVVQGDKAYVAFFDDGLYILDLSQPGDPKPLAHFPTPGHCRSLEIQGKYLYLSNWKSGMQILDIENPAKPALVGQYDTQGAVWDVRVRDDIAYVMDWWGGFSVMDIHDRANPLLLGTYQGKERLERLLIKGNYGFGAAGSAGIQIFDFKNPLYPVWIAAVELTGFTGDIQLDGDLAFAASGTSGLHIMDIKEPYESRLIGRLETPGSAKKIRVSGSIAIVQDDVAGLIIADIQDPANPKQVGVYREKANDYLIEGNRIILVKEDKTVDVVDISDPRFPTKVKQFQAGNEPRRLSENREPTAEKPFRPDSPIKFVKYAQYSPHLIRKSDSKGLPLATASILGQPPSIIRSDEQALFVAGKDGLIRILVTSKEGITEISQINLGADINDLSINGQVMYASSDSGLFEIDIAQLKKPAIRNLYPTPHRLTGVDVAGPYAFLAGEGVPHVIKLLPQVSWRQLGASEMEADLPPDMPVGVYDVMMITPDGDRSRLSNGLKVQPPLPAKRKFSMEDFQKILKEKQEKVRKSKSQGARGG